MPTPLLHADKLTKEYGGFRALDSLDLSIAAGEVVGLLGPNGSGKTTALRLFLGFLRATAGRATIDGRDCWADSVEVRKRVTYLPGELRLYDTMTGRQIVHFLGKLRGDTPGPEVDDLARRLDVDPDRKLTHMSSGMKRKIALLAVLVPKVPLIILDEPTNTLDPNMRDEFLDQIRLAKAAGKAILFSSHVLQEVEAVCDRVAILRKGKLVHLQNMDELREARRVRAVLIGNRPPRGPGDSELSADAVVDGHLDLEHRGPLPELLAWLGGLTVSDLRIEPLGLSKIYRSFHVAG